jgi:hypothetical protein
MGNDDDGNQTIRWQSDLEADQQSPVALTLNPSMQQSQGSPFTQENDHTSLQVSGVHAVASYTPATLFNFLICFCFAAKVHPSHPSMLL